MRIVSILICLALWLPLIIGAQAQTEPDLIASNIFLRGVQLPQGIRYTAAVVKPTDDTALRNVSVEITLPPDAQLLEMFIPQQIQFDAVRINQAGALTLIWQVSRIASDVALDTFSFTLEQPLTGELEFYAEWQYEDGSQAFENFYELPPIIAALQAETQITTVENGYQLAGETGVQILAPLQPTPLTVRLLAADFNPPREYGDLWWCSLLQIEGLEAETFAQVIVPLRRPIAPFTALQLFQQQSDGSWAALEDSAVVTADGLSVMYNHPGGIVASGGPKDIQPGIVTAIEIQIQPVVETPPPPENVIPDVNSAPPPSENPTQPPPSDNTFTDGTSNTIIIGENPPQPTQPPPGSITDGSSNTIIISENPPQPTQPPANVLPGLTNGTPAPLPTLPSQNGNSNTGTFTDGSSNTIIIGENTPQPTPTRLSSITDGSSNTVLIGENTPQPTPTRLSSITDGSSNTIIIGEGTPEPTPTAPPPAVIIVSSGSTVNESNAGGGQVLIIGGKPNTSATLPPTPLPTFTPSNPGSITDGSSNTIIISERTPTPTNQSNANVLPGLTNGTPLPTLPSQNNNSGTITDGSSNTIIIGESTRQPTRTPTPIIVNTPTIPPVIVAPPIPAPFGANVVRVEILTQTGNGTVQCQAGRVVCTILQRRVGKGLR